MQQDLDAGKSRYGYHLPSEALSLRFIQSIFASMAVIALLGGVPSGVQVLMALFNMKQVVVIDLVASALFCLFALPQLYLSAKYKEEIGLSALHLIVSSGLIVAWSGACLIGLWLFLSPT